jgi:hypothetical protein
MRRRLLLLGLLLLLTILLTPLLQESIRPILTPLLYVFWIGLLLLWSIPQAGIWGAFVLIAVLIAVFSLSQKRPRSRRSPVTPAPPLERIESWAKLIRQSKQETYYRWQVAQHLRRLTLEALAQNERVTSREIQQRLMAGQLDLPPEIEAYLKASLTSFNRLAVATPRSRFGQPASPLDLEMEEFITFLEHRFQA